MKAYNLTIIDEGGETIYDVPISADEVIGFLLKQQTEVVQVIEKPKKEPKEKTLPRLNKPIVSVEIGEGYGGSGKLLKTKRQHTCSKCGGVGHIAKTCKAGTLESSNPLVEKVQLMVDQGMSEEEIYNEMHDRMTAKELREALESAKK